MMAANYQHIGGHENRLGRHYSRFSAFWSPADLTDQSLALRKSQNAGSNGRSRANRFERVVGERCNAKLPIAVRTDDAALEERTLVDDGEPLADMRCQTDGKPCQRCPLAARATELGIGDPRCLPAVG